MILREWTKLRNFKNTTGTTSSGTRVGMKICEHFFPNFFDIENNNLEVDFLDDLALKKNIHAKTVFEEWFNIDSDRDYVNMMNCYGYSS